MSGLRRTISSFIRPLMGRRTFELMRRVYTPGSDRAGSLRFVGPFRVANSDGKDIVLFNSGFQLESSFFWLGLDGFEWERSERIIWTGLCAQSTVILDIGANTGIYSVLAKAYSQDAEVIAFEPQPNIFEALSRSCAASGFDIRCERLALSDREGRLPFYNYGEDTFSNVNTTAGSLNKEWRKVGQASIEVDVTTILAYLEKNEIGKVDLIKIDVETLEYEVLKGYGERLFEDRPVILLEIVDAKLGEKIESLFVGKNYRFFNVADSGGKSEVEVLGRSEQRNYILCPDEKLGRLG